MHQLVANFDVHLPFNLLIKRREDDELSYKVHIDDFDVKLYLISSSSRTKKVDEEHWTFPVSEVQISVARNESLEPPPVCVKDNLIKDYSEQQFYFEKLFPTYQKSALTVLNRLILFFKYTLHNPLLHELTREYLLNPKWTNEYGEEAGKGMQASVVQAIPGFTSSSFGVKKLTVNYDDELRNALQNPVEPELYEEILADARAAIFQDNLRRAILEMAIACEVKIKQAFFAKYSAAGAAYEYLEDKGRININILELIHGAAKEAFGESFKDVHGEAYKDIDFLFRCRNKIAHRGEIIYKDDGGAVHTVGRSNIERLWNSIETLFEWLNKHKS